MIEYLKTLTPETQENNMLKELEKLRKENALLKNKDAVNLKPKESAAKKPSKSDKREPLPVDSDHEDVPDDDDDDAHDDTKDEDADTFLNFRRGKKQKPILNIHAPPSAAKKDVDQWFAKDNLKLSATKWKALKTIYDGLLSEFHEIAIPDRGQISTVAVDWGLPVKLAGKIDNDRLVKVIAVAQFLSK